MISGTSIGARVARRRTRAVISTSAALLGAAALAAPSQAAINEPPAAPHNIISFPVRDFVSADGYDASDSVVVDVLRRGPDGVAHLIGTSDPVTPQDDPKTPGFDGLVEVNHPGGGCWAGSTPDILAGDIIRTTVAGGVDSDQTTTANVRADAAAQVGGKIVVTGTAQDGAGNPLPVDQIEQRLVANKDAFDINGRRTIRANSVGDDGVLSYDAPGSIHWTATYDTLDSADIKRALGAQTRILWLGRNPAATTEGTIYEVDEVGGPAAPCTAPLAQTAVIKMDRSVVNLANVGAPMEIDGVATNDITNVSVQVGGAAPVDVVPSGGTWTASIPASTLTALPEGAFDVRTTYTSNAGTAPPAETRTLAKDTVAPAMPDGSPAPGTYATAQSVHLIDADPSATIKYTVGPGVPNLTFGSPILLTASQTIRATATDPAGNVSAVRSLAYTIGVAAAVPGGSVATTTTTPATNPAPATKPTGTQQVQGATASSPLAVSRLTLARRISITRLRVQGLRASMNVEEGTNVIRIAISKARNGAKTGRALFTTTRTPRSAGLFRVTLRSSKLSKLKPGSYVMEVAAGRSAATLGKISRVVFTVTR